MLEIEIKVKVHSLVPIRELILKKGGILSESLTEHDTYYNAPHRDFGFTDEALRIRQTEEKITLTYKGPKETILGSKVREEYNLDIPSAEIFDQIIKRLGFKPVAEVIKKREYYPYQDFSIALDLVCGLGEYVEIELITNGDAKEAASRIDKLAKEMNVVGERITTSYLELILSTQSTIQPLSP